MSLFLYRVIYGIPVGLKLLRLCPVSSDALIEGTAAAVTSYSSVLYNRPDRVFFGGHSVVSSLTIRIS